MKNILTRDQAQAVCNAVIAVAPVSGHPAKIHIQSDDGLIVVRISHTEGVRVTKVRVGRRVLIRAYPTLAHFAAQHQEAA